MKLPYLRWWIAGLLMAASVLNYLDRAALGVASARIRDDLHLNNEQYALIVNAFLTAYTFSYALGGRLADRVGARFSVLASLAWWSAANMAHGLARSLGQLMACRFLLGLGEATLKGRGFTAAQVARYGWIPFAAADAGALFGGWASSALIRAKSPVVQARKVCMLCFALLLPASLAGYLMPASAAPAALGLISVACFGHMAWGTNSLTLHSDVFPANCVASIMGITGAAGSIGGILAGQVVGHLVDRTGVYLPVFVVTACLHPLAALILWGGLSGEARRPATAAAMGGRGGY